MSKLINISVMADPHLNREDLNKRFEKRDWSLVKEVEIETDLNLNFEQKNELRQLIMEAIKKVTSPKDPMEKELLIAQQVHAYLFDLYGQDNHGLIFSDWLGKTIPKLRGLAPLIERGNVLSYNTDILQDLADHEGFTLEGFLDHIEQIWDIKTKREPITR